MEFGSNGYHFLTDSLKCYYCDNSHLDVLEGDCSAGSPGFQVTCQMDSKEASYYGDACVVGHTGKVKYDSICLEDYRNLKIAFA